MMRDRMHDSETLLKPGEKCLTVTRTTRRDEFAEKYGLARRRLRGGFWREKHLGPGLLVSRPGDIAPAGSSPATRQPVTSGAALDHSHKKERGQYHQADLR